MPDDEYKSGSSEETLDADNLPEELKHIIEQRAQNAGLATVPAAAIGGFVMHFGLEYAINAFMASDIGKPGLDGTVFY